MIASGIDPTETENTFLSASTQKMRQKKIAAGPGFSLRLEIDSFNKQSLTETLRKMSGRNLLSNRCINKESMTIGKEHNENLATPPRFVFFVNLAICQLHDW